MNYSVIAPLLRGFLRTKNVGPFVISRPGVSDSRANILQLNGDAEPAIAAQLRTQLAPFVAPHASPSATSSAIPPPSQATNIFFVEEQGSFYVADTYDRAKALANAQDPLPEAPSSPSGKRMAGRICLVTGGAQGFGAELIRHLVAEGAFAYIADINLEKAQQLEAELNKGSTRALALEVDVSDEESVKKMVDRVVTETGGLDLFINNAGVLRAGSVKDLSKKDFDFVTNINYSAYFLTVKHFSPLLALQNSAKGDYFSDIIQINSKSGLQGSNKNAAYAGGKFGGIGLTQSFAIELISDNIKVNAICPGNFFEGPLWSDPEKGLFIQYLRTGKVPGAKTVAEVKQFYEAKALMGRGCRGEDVARAVYYAVEQMYETGQAIPVTGGQIMLS